MSSTITGVVTKGVIVPNSPLPEGAEVEIRLHPIRTEVPPDLQEELDAWERAGQAPSKWSNILRKRWKPMKKGEIWRVLIPAATGTRENGGTAGYHLARVGFQYHAADHPDRAVDQQASGIAFDGTLVIQPDPLNGLTAPPLPLCFKSHCWTSEIASSNWGHFHAGTIDQIFDLWTN